MNGQTAIAAPTAPSAPARQDQEIAPGAAVMALGNVRVRRIGHPNPVYSAAVPPRQPPQRQAIPLEEAELCDRLPHKTAANPDRARVPIMPPAPAQLRASLRGTDHLRLALFEPDIPQNTGALLRLAACFAVRGRPDRAVRVCVRRPPDAARAARLCRTGDDLPPRFVGRVSWRRAIPPRGLVLLTTAATWRCIVSPSPPDDTLLLGRESAGVPDFVHGRRRCPGA